MKKIIAGLMLAVLLIITATNAGNIYPVDFSDGEKIIELALKEGVEFPTTKGILILQNIKDDDGVDLKMVLPDGKVWGNFPLEKNKATHLDIDRDNDKDLSALLYEVKDGKAKIGFSKIGEETSRETPVITNEENKLATGGKSVTGSAVKNTGSKTTGVFIVIGIVIAGLVVYLFVNRKSAIS